MVALVVLLAACPDSSSVTLYDYVCANGTPEDGGATEENTTRCKICNSGYTLTQIQTCVTHAYVCENGIPSAEDAPADNITKCQTCSTGYVLTAAETCTHAYVCENGTPVDDTDATAANITKCQSCANGYVLTAAETCNYAYVCNNGTPVDDADAAAANITKCQSCANGYVLTADETCNHAYVCNNGTPSTDTDAAAANITKCQSCTNGYVLTAAETCNHAYVCSNGTPISGDATDDDINNCAYCRNNYILFNSACIANSADLDGDGTPNATDIDIDNDGLIEVHNLTMVHNMRYNLSGTSYKTSSAGTGSTTGGPTSATTNCSTATGGVYLCGYELTQSLTFDTGTNGTFTEENGTYRLDSNDHNATYFPVSSGAGGWAPIGDNTNAFTAIFEGNSYTITGLAIKRNQSYVGMFGYVNTGAHIRNIGLVANLADYSGSSLASIYIGGLVGRQQNGSITGSYATGSADGGEGTFDNTGGLVGSQQNGSITASYATGSVNGGDGNTDYTGGLVGYNANGSISASYATGSVNGGDGNTDYTGGLVGAQGGATSITASYATGSVDGGAGTGDYVGQLIGRRHAGSYTASYGFGTKSGHENNGIDGTSNPAGVSSAARLTATNTVTSGSCVGIDNSQAYTASGTCTATIKTACTWASNACSGTVTNIDCTVFGFQSTCTATNKTAGTWTTNVWNNAAAGTASAWDFGTSSQLPALRYADYDGSGNTYNCNQFPSSVICGTTLLPGQR